MHRRSSGGQSHAYRQLRGLGSKLGIAVSREVQPGDVIAGKYIIERLLGRGGMGVVFVARQDRLDRRVAIKFLLPEAMSSPSAVARFERESRAAAALLSDHATRVHDVGHLASGEPYMVMELLLGEDLAVMLQRRGPLPVPEVIDIVVQVCDAIAEAHSIGVVHRDLKPANIFLVKRPNGKPIVKVLDFGISKARGTTGASLTGSASLMGSPHYMSPEQVREARTVDGRADIWALGVTLYELLTGRPPFPAQAIGETCAQILTLEPDPPRHLRPDLSPALDAIVMRCLRKDAGERVATAAELAALLEGAHIPTRASQTLFFDRSSKSASASGAPSEPPVAGPRARAITTEAVSKTRAAVPKPGAHSLGVPVLAAAGALAMVWGATWGVLAIRGARPATSLNGIGANAAISLPHVAADAAFAVTSAPRPIELPSFSAEASALAPVPVPEAAQRTAKQPVRTYPPQPRPELTSEGVTAPVAPAHSVAHNPLDLPHLQ
jgi:serine/threonine protein kinase